MDDFHQHFSAMVTTGTVVLTRSSASISCFMNTLLVVCFDLADEISEASSLEMEASLAITSGSVVAGYSVAYCQLCVWLLVADQTAAGYSLRGAV